MMLLEYTTKNDKPNLILGYTTRQHLLLDIDNTTLSKVVWLLLWLQTAYKTLGNCLLVLSYTGTGEQRIRYTRRGRPLQVRNRDNYHLVFDASIGYNSCCRIISILAGLGILNRDYLYIRSFRGDMTLRVSPKVNLNEIQPFPEPIQIFISPHQYKRGGNINTYLSVLDHARKTCIKHQYFFSSDTLHQIDLQLSRLSQKLQA